MKYIFLLLFSSTFVVLDLTTNAWARRLVASSLRAETHLKAALCQGVVKWFGVDVVLCSAASILLPIVAYKWLMICMALLIARIGVAYFTMTGEKSVRLGFAAFLGFLSILGYFVPFVMIAIRFGSR